MALSLELTDTFNLCALSRQKSYMLRCFPASFFCISMSANDYSALDRVITNLKEHDKLMIASI